MSLYYKRAIPFYDFFPIFFLFFFLLRKVSIFVAGRHANLNDPIESLMVRSKVVGPPFVNIDPSHYKKIRDKKEEEEEEKCNKPQPSMKSSSVVVFSLFFLLLLLYLGAKNVVLQNRIHSVQGSIGRGMKRGVDWLGVPIRRIKRRERERGSNRFHRLYPYTEEEICFASWLKRSSFLLTTGVHT